MLYEYFLAYWSMRKKNVLTLFIFWRITMRFGLTLFHALLFNFLTSGMNYKCCTNVPLYQRTVRLLGQKKPMCNYHWSLCFGFFCNQSYIICNFIEEYFKVGLHESPDYRDALCSCIVICKSSGVFHRNFYTKDHNFVSNSRPSIPFMEIIALMARS
jgi:hypothetical protein